MDSSNDVILTKEQPVLTKIKTNHLTEKTCKHYRTDLYFHDFKLAIEISENGHSDGSIDYEIRRQKAIEQELVVSL